MARIRQDQPLVPSVLDRLLDDEPDNQKEVERSRNVVLRDIKQAIRRDLENLLNTRCRSVPYPPELEELERSLANYGIPDFTVIGMGSRSARDKMRQTVEEAIRLFEPRFKTVRVVLLKNDERSDRTLRFRIEALMFAEPAPEPIVFDSQLEPATGDIDVKSQTR